VTGLEELYRQQAEPCGRLAFLLTSDSEQAQELVQEAFVRLMARWRHIKDPLALRSYLRRTITNLAIKGYRKKSTERAYLRQWGRPAAPLMTQPDIETRHQLMHALKLLPLRQRAVVVLRYYEDLPEKDIAEILRCPLGTVKSSLSRALGSMRVQLEGAQDE
jgi:RNA polymerase sigma-70 factor (sigma-E family)